MIVQQAILGGYSAPNIGYVRTLYLLDYDQCLAVLDPLRHQYAGAVMGRIPMEGVVVESGAVLTRMVFPPKACTLSVANAGSLATYSIDYDLPGTDASIGAFCQAARERQYVCLLEDNNGRCYLLGNEERGLRLGLSQAVGAVASSRLTLSGRLNVPLMELPSLGLADVFGETAVTIQEVVLGGYQAPNIGYVRTLYLLDHKECLAVLDPIRHQYAHAVTGRVPLGGVVVELGAVLTRMVFPPKACTLSVANAGSLTSYSIDYDLPGTDVSIGVFFQEARERQYVCLLADSNDRFYIVGNEERGLRLGLNQAVGAVANSRLSLGGRLNVPLMELPTFILADLFAGTEFGIDFSFDYNA